MAHTPWDILNNKLFYIPDKDSVGSCVTSTTATGLVVTSATIGMAVTVSLLELELDDTSSAKT